MNRWQWFWLVTGMIYLISPIDFIPDLIPGLGNLDDAGVILFVIQKMLAAGQTKVVSAAPKLTAR
jgi:uncharacterized membrane protein YkvA (DUF1232 family)